MNTVVLLLMASTALAWIWVLAGSTPFASLVMIDLGSERSYMSPRISQNALLPLPFSVSFFRF